MMHPRNRELLSFLSVVLEAVVLACLIAAASAKLMAQCFHAAQKVLISSMQSKRRGT
jgi:hypothetical protein